MAGAEKSKRPAALSQSPERESGAAQIYDQGAAGSDHRLVYRKEKIIKNIKYPLDKRGYLLYYIQARVLSANAMKQEIAAMPVTSAEYVR